MPATYTLFLIGTCYTCAVHTVAVTALFAGATGVAVSLALRKGYPKAEEGQKAACGISCQGHDELAA